ncbi:putative hydantoin racemase [Paraburkholderia xenovorans LB400]|nr:putative hydantoin racemase [Paraburkholderia xenovorans LB400]
MHGTLIGMIVLDTGFARLPGDVAHAATWDFPVQFRVVRGVRPRDVIERDPAQSLGAFYAAIDDLVATGVRAIATSCGFLAAVHPELRAYSPVPFASSSLMQIPLVLSLLPQGRTVGVLVSDKASITDRHFLNVGAPLGLPLGELPYDGPIRTGMRENRMHVDAAAQERDALDATARMLSGHPGIGAIISECANLPPYAAAMEREFGLPVYDAVTLVNWLQAGLAPLHFAARGRSRPA